MKKSFNAVLLCVALGFASSVHAQSTVTVTVDAGYLVRYRALVGALDSTCTPKPCNATIAEVRAYMKKRIDQPLIDYEGAAARAVRESAAPAIDTSGLTAN